MTIERNKETIADAIEKHLDDTGRKRVTIQCLCEDEAGLLAHEMRKRGWEAEAGQEFSMKGGELSEADVVRVRGRKAESRG